MIEVVLLPEFKKNAKKLNKRYASFARDFENFLAEITANPLLGTDLGGGLRKVRMRISAKGKGKSGGARIISHNILTSMKDGKVTLVTIYDKSNRDSISKQEIEQLLKSNGII